MASYICKENYLAQIILFCPTELGIKLISSLNFRSTKWKIKKIKDGGLMKPFPKAVKRRLQKKPLQFLANKGAVGSHATAQEKCCMAFLGLPLLLVLSL